MAILIGDVAPDFEAETTEGKIRFHDYIDGQWAVLFSHPKNFTPVCTTELGYTAKLKPEFDKRGVKVLGLSVDKLENHAGWAADIAETQGATLNFPLISDADRSIATKLRQIVRAIQIERVLSKDEILDLYLALAPFGGNLEGVRSASLASRL